MTAVAALTEERGARLSSRLAAALRASRANHTFPDLRVLASHLELQRGAIRVGADTGLPTYETWARMRADWQVARESAGPRHTALSALPPPRLGDLDVALRSADRRERRLHAVLDKVAADGRLLRLCADLTVERSFEDEALFDVLFPAVDLPAELLLVRVAATRGVRAVERVSVGAVDVFADIEVSPGPPVDPPALRLQAAGGLALSLAASTCAGDLTPGDNDFLEAAVSGEAMAVRARLGTEALPQRLYRDRKWVVNRVAAPLLAARARVRGTRTVFYAVEAP